MLIIEWKHFKKQNEEKVLWRVKLKLKAFQAWMIWASRKIAELHQILFLVVSELNQPTVKKLELLPSYKLSFVCFCVHINSPTRRFHVADWILLLLVFIFLHSAAFQGRHTDHGSGYKNDNIQQKISVKSPEKYFLLNLSRMVVDVESCFCNTQLWIFMRLTRFVGTRKLKIFIPMKRICNNYWKPFMSIVAEREHFGCFTTCLIEWNEEKFLNRWRLSFNDLNGH